MKYGLFFLLIAVSGCTLPQAESSLYQRLGEMEGITQIANNFLYEISENKKIIHHFEKTDLDRFHEKLIEKICNVSDGPCEYTGDSMTDTHRHLTITESEFNSTVNSLIAAMNTAGIPIPAQNALLAKLAPMHNDIIGNEK